MVNFIEQLINEQNRETDLMVDQSDGFQLNISWHQT